MTAKQDLESKYIATLLGCVSGDCLGSEFEFRHNTNFQVVVEKILHDDGSYYKLYYTDDTALTRATCESLVHCGALKPAHLAWSLTKTFLENTKRGYAMGARCLFNSFKKQCDTEPDAFQKNPYKEPTSLFDGSGSLGNGSGMRISPIALWTINESVDIMTLTGVLAISLTHSNEIGIIGGLQQCFAIRLALESNWQASEGVSESFYDEMFDKVINYVEDFEKNGLKGIVSRDNNDKAKDICENYKHFMEILLDKTCKNITDIYSQILKETKKFYKHVEEGNVMNLYEFYENACNCGVKAHESIPVALFAFLVASNKKCEKEVNDKIGLNDSFSKLKPIDRVILYAISLGGDTDTIASMAGAIAGAFYGYIENKTISSHVVNWCEGTVELKKLASELYVLRNNKEVNEKKEDTQMGDIKKDETVIDNAKNGEIQNNEAKKEEIKIDDTKKEEHQVSETQNEDTHNDDTKKEVNQKTDA